MENFLKAAWNALRQITQRREYVESRAQVEERRPTHSDIPNGYNSRFNVYKTSCKVSRANKKGGAKQQGETKALHELLGDRDRNGFFGQRDQAKDMSQFRAVVVVEVVDDCRIWATVR